MNQKGFAKIILVVVIVAVVAVAGYFVLTNNKVSTPSSPAAGQQPQNEMADWKTYNDTQYDFEIRYPSQWFQSIHGATLVLSVNDLNKGDSLSISSLEGYGNSKLEDIYNGNTEKKIDFKRDCTSINFAGTSAYDCPTGLFLGKHAIFFYNNNVPFVIHDNIDTDISHKIISTFKFVK